MKWISLVLLIMITTEIGFSQYPIPYRDGDKWGYSNSKGEIIVEPQFEEVQIFRTNSSGIKKDGKYAAINSDGKIITDFEYDTLGYWGSGYIFGIRDENRICLDGEGKEVKCMHSCGTGNGNMGHQFQQHKEDGKIGLYVYSVRKAKGGINLVEIDTLPAIWDELLENNVGFAAVKKEDTWGIIDFNGKLIVDYDYDSISVSKNYYKYKYLFKIELNGKVGFLNNDGSALIPTIYHKADFFRYGLAKVWINENYWGYIDEKGHEYFTRNQAIPKKQNE